MDDFVEIFSFDIVASTLQPLLFEMCNDAFAAVRREACSKVGALIRRLANGSGDSAG